MKKFLEFINKNIYSLLIITTSIVFIVCIVLFKGVIKTPLGPVSFAESFWGGEFLSGQTAMEEEASDFEINVETIPSEDLEIESSEALEDVEVAIDSTTDSAKDAIEEVDNVSDDSSNVSSEAANNLDNETEDKPVRQIKDLLSAGVYESTLNEEGTYSWLDEFNSGITPVEFYSPEPGASRYYRDLGITPLNTNADYKVVGKSYFENTCWIGDSRMLGVYDYSDFDADFYCDNGFCFYNYHLGKPVTYQKEHKKVNLDEVMQEKEYDKIYVIMGINDCGYMTTTDIRTYMNDFVTMLRRTQPNAIIFLCANMHVTAAIENSKAIYSNRNINAKNVALASLADGNHIYYIDYNYLFTDENGYLLPEYTFDGFHLYGQKYSPLIDFFYRHGISVTSE